MAFYHLQRILSYASFPWRYVWLKVKARRGFDLRYKILRYGDPSKRSRCLFRVSVDSFCQPVLYQETKGYRWATRCQLTRNRGWAHVDLGHSPESGECEVNCKIYFFPHVCVKTDFSITIGVIVTADFVDFNCGGGTRWQKVRQSSLMQAFYTILKSQTLLRWAVTNKAGVHSTTRCLSTGTKCRLSAFQQMPTEPVLTCCSSATALHMPRRLFAHSVVNILSCTFDHVHCAFYSLVNTFSCTLTASTVPLQSG